MQRTRPAADEIFTSLIVYRLILEVRSAVADALPVTAFFAASLGWGIRFNHATPTSLQLASSTGIVHSWLRTAAIPVPPALIAAFIFAIVSFLLSLSLATKISE